MMFDWASLDIDDAEMRDYKRVAYVRRQLQRNHEKPFFLACGIYRPHLPWYVPKKYFDMFPLESIQLPKVLDGDLDDLSDRARDIASRGGSYHKHVLDAGQWKQAVQGYLASIPFADAMLGRLLDALERSLHANNTIVILCGLPPRKDIDGRSLVPLLRNPEAEWNHPAISSYDFSEFSIRTERWRYTRLIDGSEELYDHHKDPEEWINYSAFRSRIQLKCLPSKTRNLIQVNQDLQGDGTGILSRIQSNSANLGSFPNQDLALLNQFLPLAQLTANSKPCKAFRPSLCTMGCPMPAVRCMSHSQTAAFVVLEGSSEGIPHGKNLSQRLWIETIPGSSETPDQEQMIKQCDSFMLRFLGTRLIFFFALPMVLPA